MFSARFEHLEMVCKPTRDRGNDSQHEKDVVYMLGCIIALRGCAVCTGIIPDNSLGVLSRMRSAFVRYLSFEFLTSEHTSYCRSFRC